MKVLPEIIFGVDSWIIQDGNYGDFSVGDIRKFALEFFASKVMSSESENISMHHLGNGLYKVCGEVIFVHPEMWAIDVGVKAFWESAPPDFVSVGTWIEAEISLGIDPFFYMEYLYKLPDVPNLYYDWEIVKISINDTPWIETKNEHGGSVLNRDPAQERWRNVKKTDAWNDDSGKATYVFQGARK